MTAKMAKMQHACGAPISDDEVKQIGAYLAAAYGSTKANDPAVLTLPPVPSPNPGPAAKAKAAIDLNALRAANACLPACLGHHTLEQKVVGRACHGVAMK